MRLEYKNDGFVLVLIIIVIAIFLVGGFFVFKNNSNTPILDKIQTTLDKVQTSTSDNVFSRQYSQGKCQGKGTTIFTYSPMKLEDIGEILPYGIMVGAHVIPTSHGYISPINFQSERDAYPVYAIADGTIVNISHRGQFIGDETSNKVTDEYQMYFEHSCTFYSYYDLLTSLAPEIEREVGKLTGFEQKQVRIPVTAGQLVGRVGGQTVDFAVWNFEKTPSYFVNPKSYDEDRLYLDDMFLYFKEPLRKELLAKNKRSAEPRTGKVNYDIDGKIVGNWFREGSGGFMGPKDIQTSAGGRYWDGHLSISYDFIDPSKIIFSIGNFNGKASQFNVFQNTPDPATIGVREGLTKYELESFNVFSGTALVQLLESGKLKVETFPNKQAREVTDFTDQAEIYTR